MDTAQRQKRERARTQTQTDREPIHARAHHQTAFSKKRMTHAADVSFASTVVQTTSDSEDDEDEGLRCPISRCVFKDPVLIVGSGNTYERKSIETFFEKLKKSNMPLRDPLTNEPLSNSRKACELITNWERRRAVQKYLEKLPLDKLPSGWETREVPKAKEFLMDEKRRKMGKVGVFLEQLEEVGRWTVTHAHLMAIVFLVALVFPLDLYSGDHPIWGKNGVRRGADGEEFDSRNLLFKIVFGRMRVKGKEQKRMEMINEAFDSKLTQEHGGMAPVTSLKPYGSRVVAYKNNKSNLLYLEISPAKVFSARSVSQFGFSSFWIFCVSQFTRGALRANQAMHGGAQNFFLPVFSVPFWGVGFVVARDAVLSVTETKIITISPETFTIKSKIGGFDYDVRYGNTQELTSVKREVASIVNGVKYYAIVLRRGVEKMFVENGGLENEDNDFVIKLIADALRANSPKRWLFS